MRRGQDWAAFASTPNRYAVLASTTDDEGPVEVVQQRQSKLNRNRRTPDKTPQQQIATR